MIDVAPDSNTVVKTYTWGLDLSGDLQGAGGVGGLLCVTENTASSTQNPYYPTYDANGNISEYVNDSDSVVAHYEYSPFGKITSSSGSKAADFNHRFSTKYLDDETALYYYGYRYYSSELGRWLSRDPIGEEGGLNVYVFVGNNGLGSTDAYGLHINYAREFSDAMAEVGWAIFDKLKEIYRNIKKGNKFPYDDVKREVIQNLPDQGEALKHIKGQFTQSLSKKMTPPTCKQRGTKEGYSATFRGGFEVSSTTEVYYRRRLMGRVKLGEFSSSVKIRIEASLSPLWCCYCNKDDRLESKLQRITADKLKISSVDWSLSGKFQHSPIEHTGTIATGSIPMPNKKITVDFNTPCN